MVKVRRSETVPFSRYFRFVMYYIYVMSEPSLQTLCDSVIRVSQSEPHIKLITMHTAEVELS